MPTTRSEYGFEQFEEVLQNMAHRTALDAVENMKRGDVSIRISGSKFSSVETDEYTFKFYAHHASFEKKGRDWRSWLNFDVEDKLFTTSNHRSKISFSASEEDREEKKKRILELIENMMAEAQIKPIPRFRLSDMERR